MLISSSVISNLLIIYTLDIILIIIIQLYKIGIKINISAKNLVVLLILLTLDHPTLESTLNTKLYTCI